MKRILSILLGFLCLFIMIACGENDEDEDLMLSTSKMAYIVNGTAETMSVFDIEKAEVKNDVLALGKYPADIKLRGDKAYVVNSGDNNIQIIDIKSLQQIGVISTGDNTSPEKIDFLDDNKAYVSCLNTNSVKIVDMALQKVTKEIEVGMGPWGVAVVNQKVYVCNPAYDFTTNTYGEGTVSVIDTKTDEVINTISVETNPTEITVADSMVLVLCTGNYVDISGKLCMIDSASDDVIKTVDLDTTPNPGIAISPGGVAYISTAGGLISMDVGSGSMEHTAGSLLSDFAGGYGLAFDGDGNAYICVPDWTGAGGDKLLVMDAEEKLVGTYTLSGGASVIAIGE